MLLAVYLYHLVPRVAVLLPFFAACGHVSCVPASHVTVNAAAGRQHYCALKSALTMLLLHQVLLIFTVLYRVRLIGSFSRRILPSDDI